jgi:iron complex outermembrane receptor protein
LGVDFGISNDKLYGSVDFYLKETTDLLFQNAPAQPALATLVFENLDAIVENKGWELSLGYNAVDNDRFSLTFDGNVSRNHNLIKDFGGNINAGTIYGPGLSGAFAQQLTGGRPLFSYYLREFAGFDANGQPIRDNQKFVDKSALPEWNAGLSINMTIGNFDFAAYATGQFGFWVYNNTQNGLFTAGILRTGRNVTADVVGNGESGSAEAAVSTRFLHKGDFIRMQNVSVGYNVPTEGNGFFKNMRVYVNAQNLFLITKYNGLDPEVSTSAAGYALLNGLPTAGIDWSAYPRPRVFTLGLNATF